MHKITLLVGVAIGYVLGAKAGRERYEQFADQASKAWADPRVQTRVEDVRGKASEAAAGVAANVKDKASEVAPKATQAAESAISSASDKLGRPSPADMPGHSDVLDRSEHEN